jgi:uroporphyrinogen III methyltransferase/synthase
VHDPSIGDALADAMGDVKNKRVLLVRAARSENNLVALLQEEGASVSDVAVYDTEADTAGATRLKHEIGSVDVVTFTASSAVRSFVEHVGPSAGPNVVVIGPITAQTARDLGIQVAAVAKPHTATGIVEAIVKLWEKK